MVTFKQFLIESVYKDFYDPPPRAKFQIGDIVVVRDSGRWLTYQSKKTLPYINQVGKVIAYKNIPGAYSKFAIEFLSDSSVHGIHGHFLYGPFKDTATAEKYGKNPSMNINPSDLVKPGSLDSYEGPFIKNERLEKNIADFFTDSSLGFNWLSTPLEFPSNDGKAMRTVLAVKPIRDLTPALSNDKFNKSNLNQMSEFYNDGNEELINLLKTNFVIFRLNHGITKKLKNFTYTANFAPGRMSSDPFPNQTNSPYAVYMPYTAYIRNEDKAYLNYDDLPSLIDSAFKPQLLTLTSAGLSDSNSLKGITELIDSINNSTSEKLFHIINPGIEVKNNFKYVKNEVIVSDLNEKWFLDCDFSDKNAVYMRVYDGAAPRIISNIQIPDTVHNLIMREMNTDGVHVNNRKKNELQDLTFLPEKIKRLFISNIKINSCLGLPNVMDYIKIWGGDLTSLENFPEKVTEEVDVSYNNLENFKGSLIDAGSRFNFMGNEIKSLEGLPDADVYQNAGTNIELDAIKKYKQKEQYTRNTDKSVVSTFDDLLDEL